MSVIKIKRMEFAGILSYASHTSIDFEKHPVTQLIGENGAGKSSIATILEECLYNKNSRGIKKEALFNWNLDKKEYSISVYFSKDDVEYEVHKTVKSTAKMILKKESEDISGHTATQTYKLLEDIIGCDFTTFTKLIYQSVGSSLDFLRSTDANRKQFLTTLLAQEQYKQIAEEIKADAKEFKSELDTESGKLQAIQKIITNASKAGSPMDVLAIPNFEHSEEEILEKISGYKAKVVLVDEIEAKIRKRDAHNAKIEKQRKDLDNKVQAAEQTFKPFENLPCAPEDKSVELQSVTRELAIVSAEATAVKKRYKSFKAQAEVCNCPTCGKPMDVSEAQHAASIAAKEYQPLFDRRSKLEEVQAELSQAQELYTSYTLSKNSLEVARKNLADFNASELSVLDTSVYELVDVSDARAEINRLQVQIRQQKVEIERITEHNISAAVHNAKIQALQEQLDKASKELSVVESKVTSLQNDLYDLEVLEKAFKDLVAYKLEYSVKAFEELINEYLSILTSGKFALGFELDATKLLVVIYNDGVRTTIESCSTGQQHRIQLSTLLAIRKLMSAISKVNINLLFLDEVISFLDTKGMNTLIELLLEEHELNSFLVSHGMTHPLTHVLNVVGDSEGNSMIKENV